MSQSDVIVAGHICLDIAPKFNTTGAKTYGELLKPGKLVNTGACVVSGGGPVPNTGIGLQKIGCKSVLMGKVGNDIFGAAVREILRGYGADRGIIVSNSVSTSYTIALSPPGLDRVFLHNPGANDTFSYDDVVFDAVEQTRLFHLGYPPLMEQIRKNNGKELAAIFRRAKELGATTSLDMSLPDPNSPSGRFDWDSLLQNVLPHVDLFLPSIEEMLFCLKKERFFELHSLGLHSGGGILDVVPAADYTELSTRLIGYGVGAVALKSGHRGFYLRTAGKDRLAAFGRGKPGDAANWANRELWEPAFKVEPVVSATGSGDSSIAGFLSAFLRGETVERALRYATAAGGQNVMGHDAISTILPFRETDEMIKSWTKAPLDIQADGWQKDKTLLWHGPRDGAA